MLEFLIGVVRAGRYGVKRKKTYVKNKPMGAAYDTSEVFTS